MSIKYINRNFVNFEKKYHIEKFKQWNLYLLSELFKFFWMKRITGGQHLFLFLIEIIHIEIIKSSSRSRAKGRKKEEEEKCKKIRFVQEDVWRTGEKILRRKKKRRYSCVQVWACNASVNIQHLRHSKGASSKTINVFLLCCGFTDHFSVLAHFSSHWTVSAH